MQTHLRLSRAVIATQVLLIILVCGWQLRLQLSWRGAWLALLWTLPLWVPLVGMLRQVRRTYRWATLCIVPYLIVGVTEMIANPRARLWGAMCLVLVFAQFTLVIGYLRATRRDS